MKSLFILLCCLTTNALTADEHLAGALEVVATLLDSEIVASEMQASNVLTAKPNVMCMALLRALSTRRISNPFGLRTYATLHPVQRCADARAARSIADVTTFSFPTTAGRDIDNTAYRGAGLTTHSLEVYP